LLAQRNVRAWLLLAVLTLVTASAFAQPCPDTSATLTVFVQNLTADSVHITLDGNLVAETATCLGPGATSYPTPPDPPLTLHCEGTGLVRCGEITGLRPGAWVHRLHVTVPSTDPTLLDSVQEEAQRLVLVGGDSGVSNPLVWTIYRHTFVVSNTNPDESDGSLRRQLKDAAAYTASHGVPALITFSSPPFPGTINLLDADPCTLDPSTPPPAAICFGGSDVVVDGLDANAKPGSVVWSVGTSDLSVLRVYGSRNVFRGITFDGTTDPNLPSTKQQHDTVALTGVRTTGPFARRNRVEQSIILGPTYGDGLSVDRGAGQPECPTGPCDPASCSCIAGDNLVIDSELTRAADRGMKVDGDLDGAVATLANSCVHDNGDGGIQSTLGGQLSLIENVVQRNLPGTKNGGLTVLGTKADTSTLSSQGDIVRFNGARGASVTDNAKGWLTDDYIANNRIRGSVVDTKIDVPDDMGMEFVPNAHFHGTALVCNGDPGVTDIHGAITYTASCTQCTDTDTCTCTTDSACAAFSLCAATPTDPCTPVTCYHQPPKVTYGAVGDPGLNAFTANRADNFRVEGITTTIPASGNQWEHCASGPPCDVTADISPSDAPVDASDLSDPRAIDNLHVRSVSPARPRKGDIVRVYLDGGFFDAINGNPAPNHCDDSLPLCTTDADCTTGPCTIGPSAASGTCPCGVDTANQEVRKRNMQTGANRIRLLASDGTLLQTLYPDAVTPTMLAFTMPWDCFEPLGLLAEKKDPVTGSYGPKPQIPTSLCDPAGCVGTPAGVACDDGDASTTADQCDGAGHCVGDLVSTTTSTAPPTSTSSSSSTTTVTNTSTSTAVPTTTTIAATTTTMPVSTSTSPPTTTPPSSTSSTTIMTTTTQVVVTTSTSFPSTTTPAISTSTTTSTLPEVCNPCAPLACDISLCARPKLHKKAERLANLICHAIDMGRKPKPRWQHRLTSLLRRCGVLVGA
jgi:hypothetical protein